jgi:hypothetical protein
MAFCFQIFSRIHSARVERGNDWRKTREWNHWRYDWRNNDRKRTHPRKPSHHYFNCPHYSEQSECECAHRKQHDTDWHI